MAQACHRKAPAVRSPRLSRVGLPNSTNRDTRTAGVLPLWRGLCQRSVQSLYGISIVLVGRSIRQEKHDAIFIAGYFIVGSLVLLFIGKSGASYYDWLVEDVPAWLSGYFCILAPTSLAVGLHLRRPELALFSIPATIAWIIGLHCQLRVHRIKEQNPTRRDFAKATKSIRTWASSWLIAIILISGAGVYYSIDPQEISGWNNWVICSAISVAVYSSLAKVMGEARSEEYEIYSEFYEVIKLSGLPSRLRNVYQITPFRRDVATYTVLAIFGISFS